MVERILYYISLFLALIVVLPFHEFAHAFVAYKCGDNTAKNYGRLTLNPLAHFNYIGLFSFVAFGFGWARPVPINPNNFRNRKRGFFLVSIAGVVFNYVLSFIAYPLFILSLNIPAFGYFVTVLSQSLYLIFYFGLTFFVFNLLPIFPLDGFNAVTAFSKKRGKIYYFLLTKGIYILYGLFFLSILSDITGIIYLDILGNLVSFLVKYISYPIIAFWGLIF